MFYRVLPSKNSINTIILPDKLIDGSLKFNNDILVRFGGRNSLVKLKYSGETHENVIKISENICKLLLMPLDIKYQIKMIEDEITFGPVIGLLLARRNSGLSINELNKFSIYAMSYARFQGLIYIFSTEAINFEERNIQGYYFSPSAGSNTLWKKGVFPIPSSIYRRVSIPHYIRQKLKEETENRFFNSYYFDKLEFYNIAREFRDISQYLPYTREFKTAKDLEFMFEQNDFIYIKPVDGSLGIDIIRASKADETYYFQGKDDDKTLTFNNREEAISFMRKLANKRKFIIQQGIRCLKYDNRFAGIRVIMQKDNSLKWKCSKIVCCLGKKGGICSNYASNAQYIDIEDILYKSLKLCRKEIFKKKMEIIDVCTEMCLRLDSTGENYGDLGIDVAVDESSKIWILEINKRHDHTMPLYINDKQAYYEVKTNPIKYAVAQSGF